MNILQCLGIYPVPFSKASHLLEFELPSGCILFMPFERDIDCTRAKKKLMDYFNTNNSNNKEETDYE